MAHVTEVYEVCNTWANHMDLDEQVAAECNDWKAETSDGVVFFGRTEKEARENATNWCTKRTPRHLVQRRT